MTIANGTLAAPIETAFMGMRDDSERFTDLTSGKIVSMVPYKAGFIIATKTDVYVIGETVLGRWVLKPLKFTRLDE